MPLDESGCLPLWEILVAADVSLLAGLAAFSGLGVALTRWSSTGASHFEGVCVGDPKYEMQRLSKVTTRVPRRQLRFGQTLSLDGDC